MSEEQSARAGFDWIAGCYEAVANIYSLGAIPRSKATQIKRMCAGDRVLYVGVGSGQDALMAAQHGCQVTCLDISGKMLAKVRARFDAAGLAGEFHQRDLADHVDAAGYDFVAANFFLNSFAPGEMVRMMHRLASLLGPNGQLLIADVAPPQGNPLYWILNRVHIRLAFYVFWLLRLIPYSPTYDYRDYLGNCELELKDIEWFRLLKIGPVCYQNVTAHRRKGPSNPEAGES
jgi:ubiquinone/menaquinone biosynthesis C-methylase UbiE